MRIEARIRSDCALAYLVLAACGCGPPALSEGTRTPPGAARLDRPSEASENLSEDGANSTKRAAAVAEAPESFDDPRIAELGMPQVYLSAGHAATCRLKVGDTIADLQLPDLEGQRQSLRKLMGKELTVVFFWNGAKATALEELKDLGPDIVKRFSRNGVAVVGINSGDDPQLVQDLVKQARAPFPNLVDLDRDALKQVATAKIPRTFLVDSAGKVLWFDLEYSLSTRRELVQAIRYVLSQQRAVRP